jgi:sugar phosphate isomerase/epimerase
MTPLWPIGLSTGCFYQHSIFTVLQAIRASGFETIEVCSFPHHLNYHHDGDVRRAGEMMRSLGLRPFSFHAPFADRIDITSPDDQVRDAAVTELIAACRAAALLGAENVVLHPGPEREGRPPEGEFRQRMHHAAVSLNRVAAYCGETGVQLQLENMLPHLLFGQTSDMMFLLGEINTSSVGTCLDTGHARLSGDLGNVVHKLSGHLKMVHINDNHGGWDQHLIPGDGSIDWPWLIGELQRHHFQGGLIIEMSALNNESVADTLTRARRGRDYLVNLLLDENIDNIFTSPKAP